MLAHFAETVYTLLQLLGLLSELFLHFDPVLLQLLQSSV